MILLSILLVGCGVSGGMGEPAAPPLPPARFSAPDDGLVEIVGTIGEVSAATRSFTVTSEGRLRYCVLTADANVLNNGHASSLEDLSAEQSVTVSGQLFGDVVVTQLIAVGALAAVPAQAVDGAAGDDPLPGVGAPLPGVGTPLPGVGTTPGGAPAAASEKVAVEVPDPAAVPVPTP